LVVSTFTRVKLAAFSPTSFDFTVAVIVESSTYCPAVSPVIEVHPAAESNNASIMEISMGLSVVDFMKNASIFFAI